MLVFDMLTCVVESLRVSLHSAAKTAQIRSSECIAPVAISAAMATWAVWAVAVAVALAGPAAALHRGGAGFGGGGGGRLSSRPTVPHVDMSAYHTTEQLVAALRALAPGCEGMTVE